MDMQREDYDMMKSLEEILEKDLKKEMTRITTAGTINPTDVKTLTDAVCLMLKLKEYEEWMKGEETGMSYGRSMHNYYNRPYTSYGYNSYYPNAYGYGYSGHSTKDRMIARLEDMMGEAKNEYEAKMIRDVIANIQNS